MEKGYYLCKVLRCELLHKKVYEAQILYWDGRKWLDKEDSFFHTEEEKVISAISIPKTFYETIIC